VLSVRCQAMTQSAPMSFEEATSVLESGHDSFTGRYPTWWEGERVFGGLILAQAVAAAASTVEASIPIHSLHGLFLRPSSPGEASRITVERVRDGRSFVTRRTSTATAGKETFQMLASFHVPEEGEEYQLAPASVQGPDPALSEYDPDDPFEVIELGPSAQRDDGTYESTRRAWVRLRTPLGDDPIRQAAATAYASDMTRAAFRPMSLGTWGEHLDASLDHAVWFHRPPAMDDWNLFDLHTVTTTAGRSLMRGTFHDVQGRLVTSMAQEILIRRIDGAASIAFDDPQNRPPGP